MLTCPSGRGLMSRPRPLFRGQSSCHHLMLIFLLFLLCTFSVVEAKKPSKNFAEKQESEGEDIPGVPFLIETLGKEIYAMVNRPKYRFYLYMTIGKLPDQQTFVVALNMICNLLYCTCILFGFLLLPRGYMLFGTLATLLVGPALILILLGTVGLLAIGFCLYPMASVISMWLVFFLSSQLFQVLGRKLGLDADEDGDVDFLDLLHCAARTKWGQWIGLPKLHEALNQASMDPFQEIKKRLDAIHNDTREALEGSDSIRKRSLMQQTDASSTNVKNGASNKKAN